MSVGYTLILFSNLYFEIQKSIFLVSLPKAYYRFLFSSFDKCHLCHNLLYFSHFKSTDEVNIYCSQYFCHHRLLTQKRGSKMLRNGY